MEALNSIHVNLTTLNVRNIYGVAVVACDEFIIFSDFVEAKRLFRLIQVNKKMLQKKFLQINYIKQTRSIVVKPRQGYKGNDLIRSIYHLISHTMVGSCMASAH